MAIKYLKVFLDWNEVTSELNYEEKGRLIEAMIKYANGEADIQLSGNERFLFGIMKNQINREHENYEKVVEIRRECGAKGGRPRKDEKANESKEKQKVFEKANESKKSQDKDKDKEKEKDKDKEKEKDKDKDEDEEKDKEESLSFPHTHKENGERPTLEEVEAYADERGKGREYAEKFYDHYSAVGWRMGRSPIIDWQAAFRKWEKTEPDAQPCQREKDNKDSKDKAQSGGDESYGSIDDYDEFFRLALKRSYGDDFQF